jgi:hypothetical protein
MTDPVADAIRARLDREGHEAWCPEIRLCRCCHGQCECATGALIGALQAVLDLDPSATHRDVVLTIAKELGVMQPGPLEASYDAMPEQMREML